MMKHILLPQNLYDSAQGFRPFPLIFLDCSQSSLTRKTYLSYSTALLLATGLILKERNFLFS
jgi:hypothetical protein